METTATMETVDNQKEAQPAEKANPRKRPKYKKWALQQKEQLRTRSHQKRKRYKPRWSGRMSSGENRAKEDQLRDMALMS